MTMQPPQPDPADRVDALRGGIPRWALAILAVAGALILFFVIRPLILPTYFIPSQAMAPTIVEGDRVVGHKFSTNADRGDVIIFDGESVSSVASQNVIKRVVATGGETVEFRDGMVFVDGVEIYEPYVLEENSTRTRAVPIPGCDGEAANDRCVVPDGYVFVLGDNRLNSQDSRVFGPVPNDAITAKVFMKVLPFGDIGGI